MAAITWASRLVGQIEWVSTGSTTTHEQGLLVHHWPEAAQHRSALHYCSDEFFAQLLAWYDEHPEAKGRMVEPQRFSGALRRALRELAGTIEQLGDALEDESDRLDFQAARDRLSTLHQALNAWIRHDVADAVYWMDVAARGAVAHA